MKPKTAACYADQVPLHEESTNQMWVEYVRTGHQMFHLRSRVIKKDGSSANRVYMVYHIYFSSNAQCS